MKRDVCIKRIISVMAVVAFATAAFVVSKDNTKYENVIEQNNAVIASAEEVKTTVQTTDVKGSECSFAGNCEENYPKAEEVDIYEDLATVSEVEVVDTEEEQMGITEEILLEYMDSLGMTEEEKDDPETINWIMEEGLLETQEFAAMGAVPTSPSQVTHDQRFIKNGYEIYTGVDVSKHQGSINWSAMKASGLEFAIIRIANRGWGSAGNIVSDPNFETNYSQAKAAGLKVGVYIYSQATNEAEAIQEAQTCVSLLGGKSLDLPIVMDYEYDDAKVGRLYKAGLSQEAATNCCIAFCQAVSSMGYKPMVYANYSMFTAQMYYEEVQKYGQLWLARYSTSANFAGDYTFWQFTSKAPRPDDSSRVIDMDFWYVGYNITYKNVYGATNDNPRVYTKDDVTLKDLYGRKGYHFEGWYTNSNFAQNSKVTVVKASWMRDITLYAKWSMIEYTIDYRVDKQKEESLVEESKVEGYDKATVKTKLQLPEATKTDSKSACEKKYIFAGWYYDPECTVRATESINVEYADDKNAIVILYPKFVFVGEEYEIDFTPCPSTDSISMNTSLLDDAVTFRMVPAVWTQIQNLVIKDDQDSPFVLSYEYDGEDLICTIKSKDLQNVLLAGNYDILFQATVKKNDQASPTVYEVPLTVAVENNMPDAGVYQLGCVNTFYNDTTAQFVTTAGTIDSVTYSEDGNFATVVTGFEGYKGRQTSILPVSKGLVAPSLGQSRSGSTVKANSAEITVASDTLNIELSQESTQFADYDFQTGTIRAKLTDGLFCNKKTYATLMLNVRDKAGTWTQPLAVLHTIRLVGEDSTAEISSDPVIISVLDDKRYVSDLPAGGNDTINASEGLNNYSVPYILVQGDSAVYADSLYRTTCLELKDANGLKITKAAFDTKSYAKGLTDAFDLSAADVITVNSDGTVTIKLNIKMAKYLVKGTNQAFAVNINFEGDKKTYKVNIILPVR